MHAQWQDADASPRGDPPWRHLAAINGGAVALTGLAFLVSGAGDGPPGQQRGCYVDKYAHPAGYSACSTDPDGNSQALALKRH